MQAEFVKSLAQEVRAAEYDKIEDVVAFVSWLDEELSFLVSARSHPGLIRSFGFLPTQNSSHEDIRCFGGIGLVCAKCKIVGALLTCLMYTMCHLV